LLSRNQIALIQIKGALLIRLAIVLYAFHVSFKPRGQGENVSYLDNKLNHDTQNHKKRIRDLIALAQESRARIDALLGRRTAPRPDLDDDYVPLRNTVRQSFDSEEGRGDRRISRDSDIRKFSRDSDRDYSYGDRDRSGSHDSDQDRSDRQSKGSRQQTGKGGDLKRQETSEQIITHRNSQGLVDVGGVTLTTSTLEETNANSPKSIRKQKMVESTAKVNMSPKAAKKPFKFGTISLQVKLDD